MMLTGYFLGYVAIKTNSESYEIACAFVRNAEYGGIEYGLFLYMIEEDIAQNGLLKKCGRYKLTEFFLMEIVGKHAYGTPINSYVY